MNRSLRLVSFVATILVGAFVSTTARAQNTPPGWAKRPAEISRPTPGQALTGPSSAGHLNVVAGYLRGKGAAAATVGSLRAAGENRIARTGVTHARFEQQVNGRAVYGAYAKAAISSQGELLHWIDALVTIPSGPVVAASASDSDALAAALARVHPDEQLTVARGARNGNVTTFAGGAFFHSAPTVTSVLVPMSNGTLAAGYLVETWSEENNQLHHTLVGGDGRVLNVESRTANDAYNVFVEDPLKGAQTIVAGPGAGSAESPIGWLGGDAQSTRNIRGNNVNAYLDSDANNRADRGGTAVTNGNFLTPVDLTVAPDSAGNRNVAVQNLFFLNNVIHDILYRHGFTEAAGNFQVNNFGRGGLGTDPVLAEAQDGGGTDNANFATPADGRSGRMQMFLWSGAGPNAVVEINGDPFDAKVAAFGGKLSATGITAGLVDLGGDGCAPITMAVQGKIVLLDRGNCDFTAKVLNAQTAGAVAVIVVNNQGGEEIIVMGGTLKKIRIPAVMISQVSGATLRGMAPPTATLRRLADPLMVDASLDSDIIWHEFGHGLSWRMIGGMSGPIAGAIGEGASDVVAFLANGDGAIGEYSSSEPGGIRRFPYDSYPLDYSAVNGQSVHNDGEIYAAAMWRVRQNYLAVGLTNDQVLTDFVDGMNYTPSAPTFEAMRDGMLQAVGTRNPERTCLIWRGFAALGIGVGSSSTVSGGVVTATPSFAVPGTCP